jgi:hypothetical protein
MSNDNKQLISECKKLNISGYSNKNKEELISMIISSPKILKNQIIQ